MASADVKTERRDQDIEQFGLEGEKAIKREFKREYISDFDDEDRVLVERCNMCGKCMGGQISGFKKPRRIICTKCQYDYERPFGCGYCPRRFTQKDHMINHIRFVHEVYDNEPNHKKEPTIECRYCNRVFRMRSRNFACEWRDHALMHEQTEEEFKMVLDSNQNVKGDSSGCYNRKRLKRGRKEKVARCEAGNENRSQEKEVFCYDCQITFFDDETFQTHDCYKYCEHCNEKIPMKLMTLHNCDAKVQESGL